LKWEYRCHSYTTYPEPFREPVRRLMIFVAPDEGLAAVVPSVDKGLDLDHEVSDGGERDAGHNRQDGVEKLHTEDFVDHGEVIAATAITR
jgi:hypothetical protein